MSGDVTGEKHEEKCDANKLALLTADSAEVVPSVKTGGTFCLLGDKEWYKDQNCFGDHKLVALRKSNLASQD